MPKKLLRPERTRADSEPSRPVYLRLETELVVWLDQQAKRQRRSRAYVVAEATRVLRAVVEQFDREGR